MVESILNDNRMYLKAWFDYNPLFKEVLTLEDNYLVYNKGEDKINIDSFYLPDMLHNQNFRYAIATPNELSGKDLFEIIYCYVKNNEIDEASKQEAPFIKELVMRQKNGEEFLVIVTEDDQKYRFDTDNPEKIVHLYEQELQKKDKINLKEFGSVIKNAK